MRPLFGAHSIPLPGTAPEHSVQNVTMPIVPEKTGSREQQDQLQGARGATTSCRQLPPSRALLGPPVERLE